MEEKPWWNLAWRGTEVPDEWKRAIIVPLHKCKVNGVMVIDR